MQGAREMKETASALRCALVCRMEVGTTEFQKISVKCGGNGSAGEDGRGPGGRQGWEFHDELPIRSGFSGMTTGLSGEQGKTGPPGRRNGKSASHGQEPRHLGHLDGR